jgi:hypothetical protein
MVVDWQVPDPPPVEIVSPRGPVSRHCGIRSTSRLGRLTWIVGKPYKASRGKKNLARFTVNFLFIGERPALEAG